MCVLSLSCAYAGGLLGVILFLFFLCLVVFYIERFHLERLSGRYPPSCTRSDKDEVEPGYKDSFLPPPSTVVANAAIPSGGDSQLATNPQGTAQLATSMSQRSQALLHPGFEISVLALEGGGNWCGQWAGGKGWFSSSQSANSQLRVKPGDRITVEAVLRDHWTGYCSGQHGSFPLPNNLNLEAVNAPGKPTTPPSQEYRQAAAEVELPVAPMARAPSPLQPSQSQTRPSPAQPVQQASTSGNDVESRMYQFA